MCDRDRKGSIRTGGKAGAEKSTTSIQEQASILHWKDLSYEVKVPKGTKKILNSIDGWVEPGTLTALMVLLNPILSLANMWLTISRV